MRKIIKRLDFILLSLMLVISSSVYANMTLEAEAIAWEFREKHALSIEIASFLALIMRVIGGALIVILIVTFIYKLIMLIKEQERKKEKIKHLIKVYVISGLIVFINYFVIFFATFIVETSLTDLYSNTFIVIFGAVAISIILYQLTRKIK